MAEHLEKSKIKQYIKDFCKGLISDDRQFDPVDDAILLCQMIDFAPAADVVGVKHGHWKKCIPRKINQPEAVCSNCGRDVVYTIVNGKWEFENYCPKCGAKMDGERKAE